MLRLCSYPLLHSLIANRGKMGTSMWQGLEIGYIGAMSRKAALYFREGWERGGGGEGGCFCISPDQYSNGISSPLRCKFDLLHVVFSGEYEQQQNSFREHTREQHVTIGELLAYQCLVKV